jgi:hypothetical protein
MNDHPLSTAEWLDHCEANLVHPEQVKAWLRRHGWTEPQAHLLTEQYRRRFNEHPLGYTALLVSTGVAALAAGTTGHIITAGLSRPVNRSELAIWLTILLTALPFAVWAHQWAARVDRNDVVAVWSRPRRMLALVLLWACGIVGGLRILIYGTQLVGVLVGAPWARRDSLLAGAINVAISVGITLPLGMWSFRFLHRFDGEDPTAPPESRKRPSAPAAVL